MNPTIKKACVRNFRPILDQKLEHEKSCSELIRLDRMFTNQARSPHILSHVSFTHKLTTLHNHSPYCMNCVLDWSWQWDERTCSCNGNKTTFIPLALLLHPEIIRVCLVYSHFSTSVSTSLELALIPANFHTPVQTILFYLSCRHISLSLSLWYSIFNSKSSTNTHHIWNYVAALASILTFKVSEREWRTRYTRRWTMNSERETCSMSPPTSAKCQHRDIFYRWFYLYSRRMSLVLSMKSYQFIDAINTTIPKKQLQCSFCFVFFLRSFYRHFLWLWFENSHKTFSIINRHRAKREKNRNVGRTKQ